MKWWGEVFLEKSWCVKREGLIKNIIACRAKRVVCVCGRERERGNISLQYYFFDQKGQVSSDCVKSNQAKAKCQVSKSSANFVEVSKWCHIKKCILKIFIIKYESNTMTFIFLIQYKYYNHIGCKKILFFVLKIIIK